MTQSQIENIKNVQTIWDRLNSERFYMIKEYDNKLFDMYKIVEQNRKLCDHRWPNGTSADDGAFMFGSCLICGYFDL